MKRIAGALAQNFFAFGFGLFCCAIIFAASEIFFWLNESRHWIYPRIAIPPFDDRQTAGARKLLEKTVEGPLPADGEFWVPPLSFPPTDSSRKCFPRTIPGSCRSTLVQLGTGKVLYDVTYTLESSGRRATVRPAVSEPERSILLFGDSFTFGEGVEDTETVASNLASRDRRSEVLNLGRPGLAPNDLLRSLETDPQFSCGDPLSKHRIALFTFLDFMGERVLAPMSAYRPDRVTFIPKKPRYVLGSSGKAVYRGTFQETQPFRNWLYTRIASTYTYRFQKPTIPPLSDRDFALMAALFRGIEEKLRERCSVNRFVVAIYPGTSAPLTRALIERLRESKIELFDFSRIRFTGLLGSRTWIEGEGHPTRLANRLYAELLLEALQRPAGGAIQR